MKFANVDIGKILKLLWTLDVHINCISGVIPANDVQSYGSLRVLPCYCERIELTRNGNQR